MLRDDYIIRLIQQAAAALERALSRKQEGRHSEALAEVDAAYRSLSKLDRRSFDALSSATLARLLGLEERVRAVARLSKLEGEIHEEFGNTRSAQLASERALELFQEAERMSPSDEDRSAVEELRQRLEHPTRSANR